MRRLIQTIGALATVLAAGAAPAALFDRGGGMIYDDVLKITWLQDWNYTGVHCTEDRWDPPCFDCPPYELGQGCPDVRGQMTWDQAKSWAKNLVYGGYDDWRLPTMRDTGQLGCDLNFAGGTDCGFNVQTISGGRVYSEMAHLWYVTLGNLALCDPILSTADECVRQEGWGPINVGPFQNMQTAWPNPRYWTGVRYNAPSFEPASWFFETLRGYQDWEIRPARYYAVAVRTVPEPQTLGLALLALGLTAVVRRKRADTAASTHQLSVKANSADKEETS